jgi:hypothetical protein
MVDNQTQKRTSRALETREQEARPMTWKPASTLPVPLEQEGYKFRWIRRSMLGQEDPTNVSKKRREGWEPVRAEDHPELVLYLDQNARDSGLVEVGGLILCKMPSEMIRQRNEYYAKATQQQADAVDNNFMRENDPRMPLYREKNSKVTFGSGS